MSKMFSFFRTNKNSDIEEGDPSALSPYTEQYASYDYYNTGTQTKPLVLRQSSLYREKTNCSSNFFVKDQYHYDGPHTNILRTRFIRNVYSILSLQILFTFGLDYFMVTNESLRSWLYSNFTVLFIVSAVLMIIILIILHCVKNIFPVNLLFFCLFTFVMSIFLGLLCAVYYYNGDSKVVLQAVIITLSVFIILTIFCFQTKIDFEFLRVGLTMGLFILLFWGFFCYFYGWQNSFIYSLFGSLLFCGFILYDTSRIIKVYGYDDILIVVIDLYLDIVNLFIFVLSLLGGTSTSED